MMGGNSYQERINRLEKKNLELGRQSLKNAEKALHAMNYVVCGRCRAEIPQDEYLAHLGRVHNFDVMSHLRFLKTMKGMMMTGLVLGIGVIIGVLLRGFL